MAENDSETALIEQINQADAQIKHLTDGLNPATNGPQISKTVKSQTKKPKHLLKTCKICNSELSLTNAITMNLLISCCSLLLLSTDTTE